MLITAYEGGDRKDGDTRGSELPGPPTRGTQRHSGGGGTRGRGGTSEGQECPAGTRHVKDHLIRIELRRRVQQETQDI